MKPVICDYCGKAAVLVSGDAIYPHRPDLNHLQFWVCKPCDARVGCHPNTGGIPLGSLANAELRKARNKAHNCFDPLWREGEMTRGQAYQWLSEQLGLPKSKCHIGQFDTYTCTKVVDLCSLYWSM